MNEKQKEEKEEGFVIEMEESAGKLNENEGVKEDEQLEIREEIEEE
jgi:hypothetical protein